MKTQSLLPWMLSALALSTTVNAHAHHHHPHEQAEKVEHVEQVEQVGHVDKARQVVVDVDGKTITIDQSGDIVIDIPTEEADEKTSTEETFVTYLFNKLFPFGPAGNAILATTYISGPPNLFLGLIPADINVSSLSLLVSFAIGGLLGDVFMHLLPETFSLSDDDSKKNVFLGIGMFVGFLMFFFIDKLMRILESTGDDSNGHSHGHSHSHSHAHAHAHAHSDNTTSATSSAISKDDESSELKKRDKMAETLESEESTEDDSDEDNSDGAVISNPNASIKTSAYLNLISDFTHNVTDGLAISSSFYISKNVGCTTAIATFMHEVPHEVGDFALLIQGGFTKWQAMGSQFVTALGAYLGTFIGIALQMGIDREGGELMKSGNGVIDIGTEDSGILGSGLGYGDMTLPFTAGGFLYIAFSVIPELLEREEGKSRREELVKFGMQLVCMLCGIGFMALIALSE